MNKRGQTPCIHAEVAAAVARATHGLTLTAVAY